MTTHAPVARVPFAPLDNPRLQHLASAKNRQNGILAQKTAALSGKHNHGGIVKNSNNNVVLSAPASNKRAFEPASFDEFDSENVDPAMFNSPSKKTKSEKSAFTFTLTSAKSMPPPSAFPNRLLSTPARANMGSPRAPMTAPAGRSPTKRKIAGMKSSRRVSAPYSRIDPPAFGLKTASTLPFSLDAALSGSLTTATAPPAQAASSTGATIQESMPKTWFFDIYEDTPEEEAANLMEHSTLTLDLSSDDESNKKERDDRGKENTPPEGYDAPTASRPAAADATAAAAPIATKKTELVRKKIVADEMDDGQRSPLSELETDPFFPEGLDKTSHVVVDGEEGAKPAVMDLKDLFAAPVEKGSSDVAVDAPVADVKGEITVWEDKEL